MRLPGAVVLGRPPFCAPNFTEEFVTPFTTMKEASTGTGPANGLGNAYIICSRVDTASVWHSSQNGATEQGNRVSPAHFGVIRDS